MKKFLKCFLILSFTSITIFYLMFSFVKLSVDFSTWTEESRGLFTLTGSICFFISAIISTAIVKEDNDDSSDMW